MRWTPRCSMALWQWFPAKNLMGVGCASASHFLLSLPQHCIVSVQKPQEDDQALVVPNIGSPYKGHLFDNYPG